MNLTEHFTTSLAPRKQALIIDKTGTRLFA